MTINGCTFSGKIEGNHTGEASMPASGNDIHSNNPSSDLLTIKDSVFSNNTPDRFVPIEGAWVNGGDNTFE